MTEADVSVKLRGLVEELQEGLSRWRDPPRIFERVGLVINGDVLRLEMPELEWVLEYGRGSCRDVVVVWLEEESVERVVILTGNSEGSWGSLDEFVKYPREDALMVAPGGFNDLTDERLAGLKNGVGRVKAVTVGRRAGAGRKWTHFIAEDFFWT